MPLGSSPLSAALSINLSKLFWFLEVLYKKRKPSEKKRLNLVISNIIFATPPAEQRSETLPRSKSQKESPGESPRGPSQTPQQELKMSLLETPKITCVWLWRLHFWLILGVSAGTPKTVFSSTFPTWTAKDRLSTQGYPTNITPPCGKLPVKHLKIPDKDCNKPIDWRLCLVPPRSIRKNHAQCHSSSSGHRKLTVWRNGRHRRCETTVFMDSFGGCSRAMNVRKWAHGRNTGHNTGYTRGTKPWVPTCSLNIGTMPSEIPWV